MTIYCDNLNNIQLALNPFFHALTKHIEVHYHFVRERVLSDEVELVYVPMDRKTAHIFTKPLGLNKLWKFSSALGLQHLDVLNLRGRRREEDVRPESDDEFDFGTAEEAEDRYRGSDRRKEPNHEPKHETDDGSEIVGSIKHFDLDKPNHLMAKRTRRQSKTTPKRRNRMVDESRSRDREGADKGLTSRQADRKDRDVRNRRGKEALDRRGRGTRN